MDSPEDFKNLDSYEVSQIEKSCEQPLVRKAYLRLALRTHPDKTGGDDTEFRKVAFAYSILGNEDYRKQYDDSGKLDFRDDASIADSFSRDFKVEITEEMIEADKKAYQHSEEETEDSLKSYKKFSGDFERITECLIHSTTEDFDRLLKILETAIADGKIKRTPKFKSTTSKSRLEQRQKRADYEAKQVEADRTAMGVETAAGLAALIQNRQKQRSGSGSSIEQLEAKYSVAKPKKSKRRAKAVK